MISLDISNQTKKRQIAYLLSSGFSIPFGLPSVNELTKFILEPQKIVVYHTDAIFYVVEENKQLVLPNIDWVSIVLRFLQNIRHIISNRPPFQAIESVTYEDIYDFIKQYDHDSNNEYENTALNDTYAACIELFAQRQGVGRWELLKRTIDYISCMIKAYLNINYTDVLNRIGMINTLFFPVSCQKQVDIFTLNHDLIVESGFQQNSTHLEDGFYPNENGLYYFDSGRFFDSKEKYRLIKLHGSLNWYSHNPRLIKASDPHNIPDPHFRCFAKSNIPSITTGKITKLFEYSRPYFGELFSIFNLQLHRSVSDLIVVGYGFGDKGINNVIASWFGAGTDRRMIIICKDKNTLIHNARFALWKIITENDGGRVRIIEGGLENVTEGDLCLALHV